MVCWFDWQDKSPNLQIFTDAGWAGCKVTRKSTSGGCVLRGTHLIKSWAKNQGLVALSSAESELYAVVKATAEGVGIQSIMKDLGQIVEGHVWADASAALGIVNRKGLGKVRHLDTNYLWIQDVAARKAMSFNKVLGTANPADLFTKYLDGTPIAKHSMEMRCEHVGGRAESAPSVNRSIMTVCEEATQPYLRDKEWWL